MGILEEMMPKSICKKFKKILRINSEMYKLRQITELSKIKERLFRVAKEKKLSKYKDLP